ncbi:hypothetical protein HanHA300_Chr00c0847g0817261 [Helianthus annuus]|nr:hypothetical protein HanHA300_Chr00c0847g0817261 [Helianthus annuus]
MFWLRLQLQLRLRLRSSRVGRHVRYRRPSSMAEMLEQKLVNAVGYEPFVLTRCKSEPMKTAAAKLAPDNCFWKNRKLEPLRRASFGVGAAGIGC